MRALERRLLLTIATAPEGTSDDGPLLLARVRKLTELGVPSASVDLLRAASGSAMDERLALVEAEGCSSPTTTRAPATACAASTTRDCTGSRRSPTASRSPEKGGEGVDDRRVAARARQGIRRRRSSR